MERSQLPEVIFERAKTLPVPLIVWDRDSSLLIVSLTEENEYSGEFINTGRVCIALGDLMQAVDIEVNYSPADVTVDPDLAMPEAFAASVRFTDSYLIVDTISQIKVLPDFSLMHLWYTDAPPSEMLHLRIAEHVIFDVTIDNRLAGIWVGNIVQR
ncbi:MAG TPA: hypothetical protein PLD82_07960 [Spirochaetota bacterium]|nr:hypothetical protein [Spirochaetota bacterium]HPH03404.1 hypothetical protein [Spirochaetota bacterium]